MREDEERECRDKLRKQKTQRDDEERDIRDKESEGEGEIIRSLIVKSH